ncbi:MAG: redox-sensing transcriptional repressor Rex [Acidobacteriota bacterium]
MKKKISLRVIRRISFYYEALLKLDLPENDYISSKRLEEVTGVSCNQVRQDFFYLGISVGKQKKGYQVKRLFKELKKILSIDKGAEVIVIGAGRLGRALSEYKLFKVRNINVKALFDIKKELVGTSIEVRGEKVPIYHMDKMEEFIKNNKSVKIALLSVPDIVAQDVLDKLIDFGVKGIVNFAPKILKLPKNIKDVQLINDCIGASLYKIVYQIYNKNRN